MLDMSSRLSHVKSGTVAARLKLFENNDLERRPASSASTLHPKFLQSLEKPPFRYQQRAASSYVRLKTPLDFSAIDHLTKHTSRESAPNNTPNFRTSSDLRSDLIEGHLPDSEPGSSTSFSLDSNTDLVEVIDASYHGLRIQNKTLDGTAEFATIRSRLRSVSRSKINHDGSGQDKLMLNELDSLLQDAIDEHRSNDRISTTISHTDTPSVSGSRPSTSAGTFKESSLRIGKQFENPFEPQVMQPVDKYISKRSSHYTTSPVMPSSTIVYPQRSSPSVTPCRPSSVHCSGDEEGPTIVKADYGKQSEGEPKQGDSVMKVMPKIPPRPSKKYVFPRYQTSPVKQRAELWEALYQEPPKPDPACKAPHFDAFILKESLPQQSNKRVEKQVKQARRISHRPVTPGTNRPSSCLIPLKLPTLVEPRAPPSTNSDDLLNEDTDRFSTARQSHEDIFPTNKNEPNLEHIQIFRNVVRSMSTVTDTSTTTNARSTESTSEQKLNAFDTQCVTSQSIIQSKIRELMAASQSTGGTVTSIHYQGSTGGGLIEQNNMKENVRKTSPTASLTSVRLPCEAQRNSYVGKSTTSESVSRESDVSGKETATFEDTLKEASNVARNSPVTPVRECSQKLRRSMSSRGSPFAIEQRFKMSPKRSPSRASRGVVRLNVELRSSPERTLGAIDSHVLIVRAGIDADSDED